jgi:hypothetical protein
MKADVKGRDEFKNIMMSPMSLNFSLMRLVCGMALRSPAQVAQVTFGTAIEHISTPDVVQEFHSYKVFPILSRWGMLKFKQKVNKGDLVRLS